MIPDAYNAFIEAIIEKTNAGSVKWESTRDEAYVLRSKVATIEIGHYSDPDAELSYYYFKYYNIKDRKEASFRVSNMELGFDTMEKLYAVAIASATNVKDELSSFLSDL